MIHFNPHSLEVIFMTLTRNSSVIRNDTQEPWEYTQHSGFPISILMVGEALPSLLEGAPVIGDGGNQQLVGGAVYNSSCQHNSICNSLAHSFTPICHLYWREGGYPQLNPNTNILSGYWGVLWKENYVVWIAPEPTVNACPCMPLTSEV